MSKVFLQLSNPSVEVSQLAGRLGGICAEELGNFYHYIFNLDSMADQFHASVRHFPEVVRVERSGGNSIKSAIAQSRLCDCGWTTRQECDRKCEAIADQQLELTQEFLSLEKLRGLQG